MEAMSKEMQRLIEFESQNKSRSRGTRIEDVNFYARISIQPEITQLGTSFCIIYKSGIASSYTSIR